jgi:hypothetical protein
MNLTKLALIATLTLAPAAIFAQTTTTPTPAPAKPATINHLPR